MASHEEEFENKQLMILLIVLLVCMIYYLVHIKVWCDEEIPKESPDVPGSCYTSISIPVRNILLGLMGYFASVYVIWMSRYYMPHLVTNGHHGSFRGRPEVVGDYIIYRLGSADYPIAIPGKLSTCIIPKWHPQRAGNNHLALTRTEKTLFTDIPPITKEHIDRNKSTYNTENIYYGEFTEGFLKLNETLPNYQLEKKKLYSRINELKAIIEGKYDTIQEIKNMAEDVAGSNQKLLGIFPRKKDKEE